MELQVGDNIKWYNASMRKDRYGVITEIGEKGIRGKTRGGVDFLIGPKYDRKYIIKL